MKAVALTAPGRLETVDLPFPKLEDGTILLRTESVSICATDASYYHGSHQVENYPVVLGHEYAGTVVGLGKLVHEHNVREGDLVTYFGASDFGGFAEYRAIRPVFPGERRAAPFETSRNFFDDRHAAAVVVPSSIEMSVAPILETVTAVLRSIFSHPPEVGDSVLIVGSGPCGYIAGCIFQSCFPISLIDIVESNSERANAAKEAFALNIVEPGVGAAKYDYVFDTLPGWDVDLTAQTRSDILRLAMPGARYIFFGASEKRQHIDMWSLLAKGISFHAAAFDVNIFPMAHTALAMRTAVKLVELGVIPADRIMSRRISGLDVVSIDKALQNYGKDNTLKTVIVCR